jgi:hypothetical protein
MHRVINAILALLDFYFGRAADADNYERFNAQARRARSMRRPAQRKSGAAS